MGRRPSAVLLALPAALLSFMWALPTFQGPSWLGANPWNGANYDPDYVYLLNGLNVARGTAPTFTLHPGIPVHYVAGAVIRLVHAVAGRGDLAADVLQRPELYLRLVSGVLTALYALALAGLGCAVRSATGSVLAGAVSELTPLLSATVTARVARVSPDPLILALTAASAALVIATLHRQERGRSLATAGALGVAFGVAITAKVVAVPLLLLGAVVIEGVRARAAWVLAMAVSTAACFLPALASFDLAHFLENSAHSGRAARRTTCGRSSSSRPRSP